MDARTFDDLITWTRERLDDRGTTRPRWSDEAIGRALNEAQREAAMRGRLLRDDSGVNTLLSLVEGQGQYGLHRAIFEVISVRFVDNGVPLYEGNLETINALDSHWRSRSAARPCNYFIDVLPNERLRLNLVGTPTLSDPMPQLRLDVYRMPFAEMESGDEPELAPRHHEGLIEWACYRCFMVRDPDNYDPVKASDHLATFEDQFGKRPDANVHRKQREKRRGTTIARQF